MAYIYYNPNPSNQRVGDCTVRALSKVLNKEWETVYVETACEGLKLHDMPSANHIWGSVLRNHGYEQRALPSRCPECTTVRQFAEQHQNGTFILSCEDHVVALIDGDYFDTWDSGDEVVIYYYQEAM